MVKRFKKSIIFKSLNFPLIYFIGSFPSEDRGKSEKKTLSNSLQNIEKHFTRNTIAVGYAEKVIIFHFTIRINPIFKTLKEIRD